MSAPATDSLRARIRTTLSHGPAETLHVARRKAAAVVTPPARRVWSAAARRLARLSRPDRFATAEFFAILDGHTLNVHALLPPARRGGGEAPIRAELVFRQAAARHTAPAVLHTHSAGAHPVQPPGWSAEATVLLGPRPGGLPLARGTWRVELLVTGPDGGTCRLPLRRPADADERPGPTLSAPPCPDTGALFRATTTAFGACRVAVRPARPRAEVVAVRLEPTRVQILGRFVALATGPGDAGVGGAVVEFGRRGSEVTHEVAPRVDGDRFLVDAPLSAMVPESGVEQVWDVRVCVPGYGRLRVGRYLHDLRNLRGVVRVPERRVVTAEHTVLRVRPYYTPAGSLALACGRSTTGATT